MITFREIDESNFYKIIGMKINEEDKTFVAPNSISLAEAWLYRDANDVFPYAIYNDNEPVGFILFDVDDDEKEYMIWRIMIDKQYQGKGYGREAILKAIEVARQYSKCDHLIADYVMGNNKMKHLLESLGFKQARIEQKYNEVVMRIETP